MVGLHDTKTDANHPTIRNRTGKLNNRTTESMKPKEENDYDSGGLPDHKRGVPKHEPDSQVLEEPMHAEQASRAVGDRLALEDSSSNHSNPPDPYDMMVNQQHPAHRTPRQHQSNPKPPHHLAPIVHRNRLPRQHSVDEPPSPRQQQQWGKNIEDSISGILKRLDQLAAGRDTNGKYVTPYSINFIYMFVL